MKVLKKIYEYIAPYKLYAVGNIVFNIIQVIFSLSALVLVIPFLSILFEQQELITIKPNFEFSIDSLTQNFNYYISQVIIEEGKPSALLFVSFIVVIVVALKNIFRVTANFFMAPIRNGIVKDIRNNIFTKILYLPISYYSEERKGDIISRISNDVKEIEWSIMKSIEASFREPFTIIFFLGTLIWMSPELTIFLLLLLPLSGVIIGFVGRTLKRDSKIAQTHLGELLSNIEETLSGIRVIKAFTAEQKTEQKFKKLNNVYTKVMNRLTRKNYVASPLSELLGVIVMVFIMYYGGSLVLNKESSLTPQEFIGFIAVFSQIIPPAKAFSTAYYEVRKGLASIERVNKILIAKEKIPEKKDAIPIKSFNSKIEFRNIYFKYDEKYVLKDINITLEKGQTIALVGQSGSGKTTLVDLLPRFYDIQEGEILIDNINIKDLRIKELRNLMGNVNQEPILFNDTFYENIAFGAKNVSEKEIIKAAKIANAHGFITKSEKKYQTNIGDGGTKLSGGQRQRLSIARAILKNPPIMILDEATSALDTESEKLVQQSLNELMKNRTSIVIAHRLSTIKNADVICVLDEGRIIEQGTHEKLISKNGTYKKLYELQFF